MRVALVCTGLGHVRRGFETFTAELFQQLRAHADVTLFKGGGGAATKEIVVPNVPRELAVGRGLTSSPGRAYRWEQLTFAAGITPYLLARQYDLIHYMDGTLTGCFLKLRRFAGLKSRLLFKNGGALSPEHYARADYVQLLTPAQEAEAQAYGIEAGRRRLLPLGVDCRRFTKPPGLEQSALRRKIGLPADAFVVLSTALLDSTTKRLDWLIREMGVAPGAVLVMAGQRTAETLPLEELARNLLPGRHHFLSVPFEQVHELYWAADLFVLPSTREGFGRSIVEAVSAGLPVLVHDSEHFRWLTKHPASVVDMTEPGALKASAVRMTQDASLRRQVESQNYAHVKQHFDWPVLRDRYLEMYLDCLGRA